jgi:hypothetical protein
VRKRGIGGDKLLEASARSCKPQIRTETQARTVLAAKLEQVVLQQSVDADTAAPEPAPALPVSSRPTLGLLVPHTLHDVKLATLLTVQEEQVQVTPPASGLAAAVTAAATPGRSAEQMAHTALPGALTNVQEGQGHSDDESLDDFLPVRHHSQRKLPSVPRPCDQRTTTEP